MRRVTAGDRQQEPLVLGPAGVSWTKKQVDDFFKALLAYVVSRERAKQLSIHSFRVWLACALLAAGATPEQIMLLLRWSSDAARKLYARLGERTQTSLLSAACDVPLDSVRSHTLFASEGAQAGVGSAQLAGTVSPAPGGQGTSGTAPTVAQRAAAEAVEQAMAALTSAHEWRGALPLPGQLPVAIDDDDDQTPASPGRGAGVETVCNGCGQRTGR